MNNKNHFCDDIRELKEEGGTALPPPTLSLLPSTGSGMPPSPSPLLSRLPSTATLKTGLLRESGRQPPKPRALAPPLLCGTPPSQLLTEASRALCLSPPHPPHSLLCRRGGGEAESA